MKDINKDLQIIGSGGGKGGSRTPKEAPNTLQSRSTIRLVEVLSEGEVSGIVGGLKGVYFDDTPVQNQDNSYNFPAVLFESRDGTNPQDYLPGFTEQESSVDVNVQLTLSGIVQSTSDNTVDAMRVHVRLPQGLSFLNTKNGDLNGYSVGVAIDTRPTGGTWSQVFSKTITGKTTTAYEEAYRIEKPTGISTTWEVRVRRTTNPGSTSNVTDRIDWAFKTELRDIRVGYEDAAVVGIAIDSESTGGNAPRRSYLMDGIICQVPTNYSPTVYNPDGTVASWATYSGSWNGVFKYEWTDDPAWILYDILTSERYGMGTYIDPSTIDIYSFYNAAQYNAVLVPNIEDGVTTYEPRFRWNGVVQVREDALKTIQAIAATMRAMLFSGPGFIKLVQDRPQNSVAIISNANVLEGKFNYTGTELAERITSCDVTYNNQYDRFLPTTINHQADPGIITAYGFNKMEISAIGIVSEGQARRMAKWAVDTSTRSYDIVNFNVSWNNAFVEIGDVVTIVDSLIPLNHVSGLIKGGSATSVILDRPVTITSTTIFRYVNNLGQEVTRIISNVPGTYSTLTLNAGENLGNYIGQSWGTFTGSTPRLFKISAIAEDEPGVYKVTATFHDETKYARVEEGIIVDPPLFDPIGGFGISQPGTMSFSTETFTDPYGAVLSRIRITWPENTDPLLKGYKIRWRKDATQYQWTPELNQNEYVLDNAQPGLYEFNLYAYNNRGIQSPVRTAYYQLEVEVGDSPLNAPTGLALVGGGTEFNGPFFEITWVAPPESTLAVLKDYLVEFLDVSNNVVHSRFQETIGMYITNTDIRQWYGSATRSIRVRLRARDTLLRLSTATSTTFTNPAVAVPTGLEVTPFFNYYQVNHNQPSALDYAGVLIYHSTTTGFVPSPATLVKDDVGTMHLIEAEPATTYFVRIAAYDNWGKDELIYSSELTITTLDDQIGVIPVAPTGLNVTSTIVTQPTGSQSANINITWNGVTGLNSYDLEIIERQGMTATAVLYPTVNGSDTGTQSYTHTSGVPSRTYLVRVRGRSQSAVSNWSDQVFHTAGGDSVPPGDVSLVSVTPGFRNIVLRWDNPGDADLAGVNVYATQSIKVGYFLIGTVSAPLSHFIHNNLPIPNINPAEPGGDLPWFYKLAAVDTSGNIGAELEVNNLGAGYLPLNVGTNIITALEIAAGTITANEIAAGTIVANNIAAGTITATQIAARSITADRIVAGSITAVEIAAGTITAANIMAGTITATQIAAGTINSTRINVTELLASTVFTQNLVVQTANIVNASITSAKFAGTIQSDNFVSGTSGWRIRRDTGAAEFGDLTARGNFNAGGTGTDTRLMLSTSDPTYVMWFGNGVLNDTNAKFYLKRDGSAYFGGALIAGIVNTSIQVDNTADNASAIVGPYTALANPNTRIVVSLTYAASRNSNPPNLGNCQPSRVYMEQIGITLERSTNGSSWTQVGSELLSPAMAVNNPNQAFALLFTYDGESGLCNQYAGYNMTQTVTDNNAVGGTRYYRARITTRRTFSNTGTNPTTNTSYHGASERSTQRISLIVTQGP